MSERKEIAQHDLRLHIVHIRRRAKITTTLNIILAIEAVVHVPDITTTESHGINDGIETVLKRDRSDFSAELLPSPTV